MKRRIGIFLNVRPSQGGAYQFSVSMLQAMASLPRDRFEVVAAYTDQKWKSRIEKLQLNGVFLPLGVWDPIACRRVSGLIPMKWWRSLAPYFHGPVRKIIALRCDLWIFPSQDTWTYLIPVPALGTIYDLMHRYERRFPEVSAGGRYSSRERHYCEMLHWAKGILVDSLVGKRHVIDSYGLAPDRIFVLPYVAPEYIREKTCPDGFNERYSLPKKYIYYPAQFWRHKNHKGLIRAVALLKDKIPDLNLVLSGSPKNGYQTARKTVREFKLNTRIHFLGYVPEADMPELYHRARALIMPTFFGPTNIPPLEAAATGCPMAISEIYGMRKQMEDAALYFNPSSIQEIASCIERLWNDDALCKELARRGMDRSMQLTQPHLNRSFNNIIESILLERQPPFQKDFTD